MDEDTETLAQIRESLEGTPLAQLSEELQVPVETLEQFMSAEPLEGKWSTSKIAELCSSWIENEAHGDSDVLLDECRLLRSIEHPSGFLGVTSQETEQGLLWHAEGPSTESPLGPFESAPEAAHAYALHCLRNQCYDCELGRACLCSAVPYDSAPAEPQTSFKFGVCDRCSRCCAWGVARVRVFWEEDNMWYQGCILRSNQEHMVSFNYDDGQQETIEVSEDTASDVMLEAKVVWAEWSVKAGKPALWWPAILLCPYDLDGAHQDNRTVMVQLCANLGSLTVNQDQIVPFDHPECHNMVAQLQSRVPMLSALRVKPVSMEHVLRGELEKQLSAPQLVDIAIAEALVANLAFCAKNSLQCTNPALRAHSCQAMGAATLLVSTLTKLAHLASAAHCCSWYVRNSGPEVVDLLPSKVPLAIDAAVAFAPWRRMVLSRPPKNQLSEQASTVLLVLQRVLRYSVLRMESMWSCCELLAIVSAAVAGPSEEDEAAHELLSELKEALELSEDMHCNFPSKLDPALAAQARLPSQPAGTQRKPPKKHKLQPAEPPKPKARQGTAGSCNRYNHPQDCRCHLEATQTNLKPKPGSCGRFNHRAKCQCHLMARDNAAKPTAKPSKPLPKAVAAPSGCGRYNHRADCRCHLADSYKTKAAPSPARKHSLSGAPSSTPKRPKHKGSPAAPKSPGPLEHKSPPRDPACCVPEPPPAGMPVHDAPQESPQEQLQALERLRKLLGESPQGCSEWRPGEALLGEMQAAPPVHLVQGIPGVQLGAVTDAWAQWHHALASPAEELLDAVLDVAGLCRELQKASHWLAANATQAIKPEPSHQEPAGELLGVELVPDPRHCPEVLQAHQLLKELQNRKQLAREELARAEQLLGAQEARLEQLRVGQTCGVLQKMLEVGLEWLGRMLAQVGPQNAAEPTQAAVVLEKLKLLQWLCRGEPLNHVLAKQAPGMMQHCRSVRDSGQPSVEAEGNSTLVVYSAHCLTHTVPREHVEQPSRQARTVQLLLSQIDEHLPEEAVILHPEPAVANRSTLRCVHSVSYLSLLEATCNAARKQGCMMRLNAHRGDLDTVLSENSYLAALHAAGAVCQAVEQVLKGTVKNAFCCVRPPGHHAGRDGLAMLADSQGFCLLNNVCIGMAHARIGAPWLTRLAVVDFDVHHGNGTQEILAPDPESFFCSVHRHGQGFFPGKGSESATADNLLNVGLPKAFDAALFRGAFSKQLLPALEQFAPDMIFISAGFDAHRGDVLGGTLLNEADFEWATCELCALADRVCNGRLVSVLEGGYPAKSSTGLEASVMSHVRALAGLPEFNGAPSARRSAHASTL